MRETWVPTLMAATTRLSRVEMGTAMDLKPGFELLVHDRIAVLSYLENCFLDLRDASESFGRIGARLEIAQICGEFLLGKGGEQDAAHRRAISGKAAADGEPGGEDTAGGGAGDVYDLAAVEHAHGARLVQLFSDVLQNRACGLHYG